MSIDENPCTNPDHRYSSTGNNATYNALLEEMEENGVKNAFYVRMKLARLSAIGMQRESTVK
ncbi:hypothetical protein F4X86_00310 [Candidatus Saccharibacteria bacterium]|nr:hypothetical protein [Candidatus Saccharibacteria bacterium]